MVIDPPRLARLVSRLTHAPAAIVHLPEAGKLGTVGIAHADADAVCQALERQRIATVTDVRAAPALENAGHFADLGIVAYVTTPVPGADGVEHGSISALAHEPREWTSDDVAALTDLAWVLRVAATRVLAADLRVDSLTGLNNRRHWQERAPLELSRARRTSARVCVVMLDVDDPLAYVNETDGCEVGDHVLASLGERLPRFVRDTDLLVRWGGDQFAALLPDAGADHAQLVAGRLRAAAADLAPLSSGVAEWTGDEGADALLIRAHRALLMNRRA